MSEAPTRDPESSTADGSQPVERKLWIRWVALIVFVAILGTAFVLLGRWQLDRLDQRKVRNQHTIANEANPVVDYHHVFTKPITDADQYQRVTATGRFDAEHQLVIRYRSNGDLEGYEVVAPLRTSTGVVLINRGFVSVPRGTQLPATASPPPTGEVTVTGHVRRDEQGRTSATHPRDGQARLINSVAIGATLPYPVANGYIGALSMDPPQQGDFQPVALPELSDGPHFWYAVQWFMFAGIGIAGIVVFIRGDLRERKKAQADHPRSNSA